MLAVFVNFPCLKLRSSYTGCASSIHVLKWDVTSNQGFGSGSASYSKSQVEVLIFHHMLCPSFFLFIHFKRERHLKLGFFFGILAFGIYSMSQIEVFIRGCASIHSHPKNGMSRQIRIWWCTTFLFHVPKLRFSFLTGVQIYSYSKNEGCLKFRVLCFGFGISCLKLRFPSAMSLSFKS